MEAATGDGGPRLAAADRRDQILAAARQVFIQSGLAGARVREISNVAGINEALLYRHFSSKDEMFEAAIAQPLEEGIQGLVAMADDAEAYVGTGQAHREWIAGMLDRLVDALIDVVPLLGVVLFADPGRGKAFYIDHFAPAIEAIAGAIESTNDLWEHGEFDTRMLSASVLGTCTLMALDQRFGGTLLEDREAAMRAFTNNLFDGLGPR